RAAIFRWAPAYRCSWFQSSRSRRSLFCAISTNVGMKPDGNQCGDRQGRADPGDQIWQHQPRPHLGAAVVVLLPHIVRDLLAAAAALYAHHLAEEQRRDFSGDQSLVGVSSDI